MLLMTLGLLLTAAPVSVAVPGVNCVGLSPGLCESLVDRLVTQLSATGELRVVSERDIGRLLGLERQRQLLGCSQATEDSSCLAELAGALGVDGLMSVSITRSDPYFVTTVRVIRTRDGSAWVSASERVKREGELFDALDGIAAKFLSALVPSKSAPVAGVAVQPARPFRLVPFTPGIAGVVAAGIGIGVFASAGTERDLLLHPKPEMDIRATAASGRTKEQVGVGLMIGGGVAIAASLVWAFLIPDERAPSVSVIPGRGGLSIAIGAAW